MTSRRAGARALAALLALGVIGSCTGTNPTPTATPAIELPASITVALGIYSGRPDPAWDLAAAQVAQVTSAIAALPVATGTPPEGGLGYRGFSLLLQFPAQADQTLVAFRGLVAPLGVGARSVYVDDGRTIERLLLDTGRSILNSDEIAAVEADFALAP